MRPGYAPAMAPALLLLWSLAAEPARPHLLDRVVATVDAEVVTLSRLELGAQLRAPVGEAEIDAFLARHRGELVCEAGRALRDCARAALEGDRRRTQALGELRRLYTRAKVRIVDPGFADADAALRGTP